MRSEHHWLARELRNRNEIFEGLKADLGVEMRGRRNRIAGGNDGVPIRRSLGHELNADGASGTGTAFDPHRLAYSPRQPFSSQACRYVVRAPWREGHDPPYRFRWPSLRKYRARP